MTSEQFAVLGEDMRLLEKLSPIGSGVLPPPRLCPSERRRLRLAFRNERNLYHRSCGLTGARIISLFSPDTPYKVYSKEAWWSDRWDAREYGRPFDFSRPFFEQFAELKREVPQIALITSPDADENNCPYINFAGNSKNCYMTFDSDFNEDSYYSNVLKHSRSCIDCSYVHHSELCYECLDCRNCYNLRFSQDCVNCNDSWFLRACIGCSDCFMCVNLMHKRYCIRNKQYSKKEYFEKLHSFGLSRSSTAVQYRSELDEYHLKFPKRYCRILKSENVSGDYIINCRNSFYSFNVSDSEDLRYCDSLYSAKDCMDVSSFGEQIERVYNSGTIGINCYNILMSYVCVLNCADLIYCDNCRQSSSSFGCCSLQRARHCILNQQYSEKEYHALLPKVIAHMQSTGEWGRYFPIELSPFGYNETIAAEQFPLSESEARALGAKWSTYQAPPPEVESVSAPDLPDDIADCGESVLGRAILCENSGKPFRITKGEYAFYVRNAVPLPRRHPDVRHRERMNRRNCAQLYHRTCDKTGAEMESTYPPESPDIVYCEEAFLEALE